MLPTCVTSLCIFLNGKRFIRDLTKSFVMTDNEMEMGHQQSKYVYVCPGLL